MRPCLPFSKVPDRPFQRWLASRDSFQTRLLVATFAGVGVIVLLSAIFLTFYFRERDTGQLRDVTFQILRLADRVEIELTALESSHRDYLVTGDATFLEQYRLRKAGLQPRLGELTALTASTPFQLENVARIRESLALWETKYGEPQIEMRNEGRDPNALPGRQKGALMLDTIRVSLANLSRRQADMWESASARTEQQREWQFIGFGALALLAIGIVVASTSYGYRAIQRHIRKVGAAEAQLRLIVENTLDSLLTMDERGVVLLVNPAAEKLFGAGEDALISRHVSELFPQRAFAEPLERLGRATFETEARGLAAPFEQHPVEISISDVIVDGHRQFVMLVRDITERRRNEEALRQIGIGVSAETGDDFVTGLVTRLSQALSVDCAFIVEVEGRGTDRLHIMTMAEKGAICGAGPCDLTGTACDEVLRHGFRAYLSGVQGQFPCDWLLAAFAAESFVCLPLVDHDGCFVGLLGVLDHRELERVDIVEATLQIFAARAAAELERKRFEHSLANEKEQLDVTLRSIADGCITIDNEGRVLLLNPVAERLTGWKAEDASGCFLPDIFKLSNPRSRRALKKPVQTLVQTGSAAEITGVTLITALDGTERLIETIATPLKDLQEQKVGTVLILRDVTERHRTMEERQKAEKLESLGIAAGGIAHDFNNLLTAILGNLSLVLMNHRLDEQTQERLSSAKRASLRAQELAQQLLTFAKGGSPIMETASVAQLVKDTVTFHLRGSKVRSEVYIAPDLWSAEVDCGQISQVIQNLTINAEQAMPAGGTLRVNCCNVEVNSKTDRLQLAPGRYVKITVQDEGVGIPEDNLKKIFDPYFTTKPKGSGLGLATSYSIIKTHGGIVDVVSQPGEGTVFYVYLPAADAAAPEPVPAEPEIISPTVCSARVLVLDDEEAICSLVSCALAPYGIEVVQATDAATAINVYEDAMKAGQRFDLVISDLTIPGGMGGREAVRRLREIDPNVRAIVSSGYTMDPVMSQFQDHGFCAMIAKPYEIHALGKIVADVLASPKGGNVIRHEFAAA
jgi:PAS domain S-box-containing protein